MASVQGRRSIAVIVFNLWLSMMDGANRLWGQFKNCIYIHIYGKADKTPYVVQKQNLTYFAIALMTVKVMNIFK